MRTLVCLTAHDLSDPCCCAQPDLRLVLVLVQPDIVWLCRGSRCLGPAASKVYVRRLPCACRFHAADSSPDGRLALLETTHRGPATELLLWDVAAGQLVGRRELQHAGDLGAQWLPGPRLCCTVQSFLRTPDTSQVFVLDGSLRTLATSEVYRQCRGDGPFKASPCGSYLAGVDGACNERLVVLDACTCEAMAVAQLQGTGKRRRLWGPDSSAVLVSQADPGSPWLQTSSIFWLRTQSWQPLTGYACVHVHSWAPQGFTCVHPVTFRTAELRFVQGSLSGNEVSKVATYALAEPVLLTHGMRDLSIVAAFSPGFMWLAVVTVGRGSTLSVTVVRTRTRQTVQQWWLQPAASDAHFVLRWALSGSALLCTVMGRSRTDSSTYVLTFDQQL